MQKTAYLENVVSVPVKECVQRNSTCKYYLSAKQTGAVVVRSLLSGSWR